MTRNDIIEMAFRDMQVRADDEQLTADQAKFGGDVLDSIMAELTNEAYPQFTTADVPAKFAWALARLLSAELAPTYSARSSQSPATARLRLMALINPDSRESIPVPEYY